MAKKKRMNSLDIVAIILLIIGGLNWGMLGVANFNLVKYLLGTGLLANIVYTLVGVSALYSIFSFIKLGVRK